MEPDGKLPSDFQCRQRRAVVTSVLVHGFVADAAQIVEQVDDIARVGGITSKSRKEVGLWFFDSDKNAGTCRDLLCQQLAELAKLHKAGDRIVGEVPFGQRRHADQYAVVLA